MAFLLSAKYSSADNGNYEITTSIYTKVYIENYFLASKLKEGKPVNGSYLLDGKVNSIPMEIIGIESLKHLSTDKLYSVSEDLFILYAVEEEMKYDHDGEWSDYVRMLKFSHQKENFNISAMLCAIALCTKYGWHEIFYGTHNKNKVMRTYKNLKSKTRSKLKRNNLFLVEFVDTSCWVSAK